MRLKDKVAIVVGAGQSPGEGLGNGRATVLRFAQEGAKVLAVDNNLSSAEGTVAMARQSGAECLSFEADVTNETTLAAIVEGRTATLGARRRAPLQCRREYRGRGRAARRDHRGCIRPHRYRQPARRRCCMTCKHVLPLMRAQRAGVIITISSVAAWEQYPNVVYKATKAGMIAFTQQVAIQNAEFGVRANVIVRVDRHPNGGRYARPCGGSRAQVAAARDTACRCATRWAPPGTSQMPRCFWHPMRRTSLPALRCRSMAARWSTSTDPVSRFWGAGPLFSYTHESGTALPQRQSGMVVQRPTA